MAGFFLTTRRSETSAINLINLTYEDFSTLTAPEENSLYLFEHGTAQCVSFNGITLYNIGTLIYDDCWHNAALEIIAKDIYSGKLVKDMLHNTRGQFCLIIHNNGDVYVITDKLGTFPIYKFESDDRVEISNFFLPLAEGNHVTMNNQAFAEYLSYDYCFDCTFFNEIKLLQKGSFYRFGAEQYCQVYFNYLSNIHFNTYRDLETISHAAKRTMLQNFAFLSNADRIFTDITGGFDTRMIAILLKNLNLNFSCGICGDQVLNETEIAAKVAEKLLVKFYSKIKIDDRNKFLKMLERHFNISNGVPILYHSTELIHYYEVINQYFDIHVAGYAGSQLCDNFLPPLSILSNKINHSSLSKKYYMFIDIFNNSFITENEYYNRTEKKIAHVLSQIGSNKHSDVASYFTMTTFSRYYHGALMAAHNIILPIYVPYLEANFAKLLLETSFEIKHNRNIQKMIITSLHNELSLLMTTHGYNAHIGKNINSSAKNWLFSIARALIYDFSFLQNSYQFLKKYKKSEVKPSDIQRAFWIKEIDKKWSKNMPIFEYIDHKNLQKRLLYDPHPAKLKAKIMYLDRILTTCVE